MRKSNPTHSFKNHYDSCNADQEYWATFYHNALSKLYTEIRDIFSAFKSIFIMQLTRQKHDEIVKNFGTFTNNFYKDRYESDNPEWKDIKFDEDKHGALPVSAKALASRKKRKNQLQRN